MRRTRPQDETEVLLLGFGEPDGASPGDTLAYLERIFLANARLDGEMSAADRRRRCRDLAERRAPRLQADYQRIGGSPLLAQCRAQARALEAELARRGAGAQVRIAMQFTDPSIDDVVGEVVAARTRRLVALPLYPLCGASTTLAALEALHAALDRSGGAPIEVAAVTGWHAHPGYVEAVGDAVEKALARAVASLEDTGTLLYFSAHGTPVKYLEEGSRYDRYVEEACALVAARLGTARYVIGYQNHSNRGVPWTSPSNEELLPELAASRLVVVPISFIHEQSETLVELDEDLRELAAGLGKTIVRVPVPHDSPALTSALADLVEPFLDAGAAARSPSTISAEPPLVRCLCRPDPGSYCLNGARLG